MSTSASCGEALAAATGELLPVPSELADVLAAVDPRMHARVIEDYREAARARGDQGDAARADFERLYDDHRASAESATQIAHRTVLVGHRAAGKSRVLPVIAAKLGVPAVDLDREIERVHARPLREWVAADVASFRRAEREVFASLPPSCVVAVGGGFWSNHADLLDGHVVVQVPVSFRTYRERLLADTSRPRLMADVSLEEEIRHVYRAREFVHRTLPHLTLGAFLARTGGR